MDRREYVFLVPEVVFPKHYIPNIAERILTLVDHAPKLVKIGECILVDHFPKHLQKENVIQCHDMNMKIMMFRRADGFYDGTLLTAFERTE